MGLILLEALLALAILAAIVWWTMFSGRKKGELLSSEEATASTKTHKNSVQDKPNPD